MVEYLQQGKLTWWNSTFVQIVTSNIVPAFRNEVKDTGL